MKNLIVILALSLATIASAQQTKSSNKCDIDLECANIGVIDASVLGYDAALNQIVRYKIIPTETDVEEILAQLVAGKYDVDYIEAYECGYNLAIKCEGAKYSRSDIKSSNRQAPLPPAPA